MTTTIIDRKPGDCDFDLNESFSEIKFQNSLGNKLTSWDITPSTITLNFE